MIAQVINDAADVCDIGEIVSLTANGKTTDAVVVLRSPDGKSLGVEFPFGIFGPWDRFALARTANGAYVDIFTNIVVTIDRKSVALS
jgi:hypothetical protein